MFYLRTTDYTRHPCHIGAEGLSPLHLPVFTKHTLMISKSFTGCLFTRFCVTAFKQRLNGQKRNQQKAFKRYRKSYPALRFKTQATMPSLPSEKISGFSGKCFLPLGQAALVKQVILGFKNYIFKLVILKPYNSGNAHA